MTKALHDRLPGLMRREEERFVIEHPRSAALAHDAHAHLLGGVPMHWMAQWPGGFPVFVAEAEGAGSSTSTATSTSTSASATPAR